MGSIGTMMKGSGLEEALDSVYGTNTVTYMLSGKAFSRALRGDFLIEAALTNKLLIKLWPDHTNTETQEEDMECDCDININKLDLTEADQVSDLYKGIQNKSLPVETVGESVELHKLNQCLLQYKALLLEKISHSKALVAVSGVC